MRQARRRIEESGSGLGGKVDAVLEFFVDAFIAALHDGEAFGFGVGDGKRFGQFGGIDLGNEFADGVFAEIADLQRSTVHGAHEFETLGADAAGFPGVSSDVFVDGHGGRGVKNRLSPPIARMGRMARIKKAGKEIGGSLSSGADLVQGLFLERRSGLWRGGG
jgi:hypothetical protein